MANLVIVESPTKVKTIKKYLGSNYKVMASMGHIRDLPKSKLGLDTDNGYTPQYITIRGKTELIKELKKEAKSATNVYLATDPDREGEAISWHLATILGLDLNDKIRITFNEITKNSVLEGIKHPRKINMDVVDAQQARRVLDRLVGYGISPILWKHIGKGLSAGRVQSVATKLIVDRENEIKAFVPDEYWKISANLVKLDSGECFTARYHGKNGKKTAVKCEADATALKTALECAEYTVGETASTRKQKTPMPPFTTSTLQQEASRLLNMTSKKTMQIAQALYEGVELPGYGHTGLITYMRTDSLRISEEAISAVRKYIGERFGAEYCPKSARYYKTKNGAQDAHEAIRPTSMEFEPAKIKGSLTNDQYKLYKLIWDRFTASQMAAQISNVVTADISAETNGEKHIFKASGSTVLFPGYTVVYLEFRDKEDENEGVLPKLDEGEKLSLAAINAEQKFTQPPSRYTEAALIKALEENGIGRPSTYAPTISTILQREYVVREGKSFKPTSLGTVTTEYMCDKFKDIVDVEFTAHMENFLDEIGDGKSEWQKVIKNFDDGLRKSIENAKENGQRVVVPGEETDEVCELCGAKMIIKSGRFGKFLACPNYPTCKNTKSIVHKTGAKCPKCGGEIIEKVSKNGTKYYACDKAPACDFISWYAPSGKTCKVCGCAELVKYGFKGKRTYICSNALCSTNNTDGEKK